MFERAQLRMGEHIAEHFSEINFVKVPLLVKLSKQYLGYSLSMTAEERAELTAKPITDSLERAITGVVFDGTYKPAGQEHTQLPRNPTKEQYDEQAHTLKECTKNSKLDRPGPNQFINTPATPHTPTVEQLNLAQALPNDGSLALDTSAGVRVMNKKGPDIADGPGQLRSTVPNAGSGSSVAARPTFSSSTGGPPPATASSTARTSREGFSPANARSDSRGNVGRAV